MKSVGIVLVLALATSVPASAQFSPAPSAEVEKIVVEPTTSAKLSPTVSQQLTDQLPKYTPAAPESEKAATTTATPASSTVDPAATDPEILHLKKVTVTPRKRPRLGDDVIMTTKAFNDKLSKEKMGSFDRDFLNKFSWLGGFSAAERAREEYNREQRTQVANEVFGLARVVEVSDPEQAKALRDAMNRP